MSENLSVSWSKMTPSWPESKDEIQDNEQRYESVVVRRSPLCSDEKREELREEATRCPWTDEERQEQREEAPCRSASITAPSITTSPDEKYENDGHENQEQEKETGVF